MSETVAAGSGPGAAALAGEQTRPLINRFTPMKWVLTIYAVSEGVLFLLNAVEMYYLLGLGIDIYLSEDLMGLVFALIGVIFGLLQFVTLIASFVLVSMWTYRAMKNLHIVRAPGVTMSPGWAVGWYFIPFANLWKPFEGMLQIWRGSHHMAGQTEKVASFVGWWWAFWLTGNVVSNIALRLGGFMGDGEYYAESLWFYGAASLLAVACTWCLLRTTRRITDMQAAMREGGVADTFR